MGYASIERRLKTGIWTEPIQHLQPCRRLIGCYQVRHKAPDVNRFKESQIAGNHVHQFFNGVFLDVGGVRSLERELELFVGRQTVGNFMPAINACA